MTTLLVVIGVSLAVSFICSILEAVLLSVSHSYVALMEERGERAGSLLAHMRQNIEEPISAILTLNTIAHTVGASVGGALALDVFGNRWIALFSAVLTLAILLLSEILPKTIGATHWQRLAPGAAHMLRWMVVVMKPVLIPLSLFNRMISPRGEKGVTVSRAELDVLAEIGRREGAIDEDEWRVVTNVMNLDEVRVGSVMTPRTSIAALPADSTVEQARDLMLDAGRLRLPVYAGTLDNVVGIVLARDLWKAERAGVTGLADLLRTPQFVPQSKPVEDLIKEMRLQRIKMVIVLDEFGGTAGLVTLEDLIEEIVGEIQDEHEMEPGPFEEVSQGETRIAGSVSIDEVNDRFDLDLPVEQFDTIGGFVFGHFGRVPQVGDQLSVEGGYLRVVTMSGRRVEAVAFGSGRPSKSG